MDIIRIYGCQPGKKLEHRFPEIDHLFVSSAKNSYDFAIATGSCRGCRLLRFP